MKISEVKSKINENWKRKRAKTIDLTNSSPELDQNSVFSKKVSKVSKCTHSHITSFVLGST